MSMNRLSQEGKQELSKCAEEAAGSVSVDPCLC